MNIVMGGIIIVAALFFMGRRVDSKVILFTSGIAMAIFAGDLIGGLKAFSQGLKQTSIMEPIITSMGFAAVMSYTGCDKHLVYGMLKALRSEKAKAVLLPGTMLVTMIVNVALNSATATAASIGAVMIPVLVASGYHPAAAGAAILASTYGSVLNPGHSSNALVAKISSATPVDVVANQLVAVGLSFLAQAVILTILIYARKENRYQTPPGQDAFVDTSEFSTFKVNPLRALCVLVPLIILSLGTQVKILGQISVGSAMILGCIAGLIVTRTSPKAIMSNFWQGAGKGFAGTFSIVVCASVFVVGMTLIGLIQAMIDLFINNPSIAKISAVFGPAFMSVLTGTGTGMAVAFNEAVSANAAHFGMLPMDMGSLVTMTSCLARAVSPVAGVVILTSGLARCTPFDVISRQLPGFAAAILVSAVVYLF